jgi:hypothetical protein
MDPSCGVEPKRSGCIVDRAVVNVYEMLGRLTDLPDDLKHDATVPWIVPAPAVRNSKTAQRRAFSIRFE